jgi:hypothetical protein
VHLEARLVQGSEEPEPEDVVHVEMREEDVDPGEVVRLAVDRPDARSGVEDRDAVRHRPDRDARRVAAVARRPRPGARQGASHSPQDDVHRLSSGAIWAVCS